MMKNPPSSSSWEKRRFDWKHEVNRSPSLPRSAKQFASLVCDELVSRSNGQFFHRNTTMADYLHVSVRSIERYISALQKGGWLRRIHTRHRKRVLQLAFPIGHHMDRAPHEVPPSTKSSAKADNSVGSYTNQGNNQKGNEKKFRNPIIACVLIAEVETQCIGAWKDYIETNTPYDFEALLPKLKQGAGYQFPSRYPPECGPDNRITTFFGLFMR